MKTDHPHRPPGHLQTLPRRQFVKLAALTGGAIAAPAITPFSLLGRGEIAPPDAGMTRIELAHEDYNKDLTDHGPWTGMAAAEEGGAICKQLDPERYYQPSSPYGGANANNPREGNTHGYTNMWFVPGYDYLNFASEDNRISAALVELLRRPALPHREGRHHAERSRDERLGGEARAGAGPDFAGDSRAGTRRGNQISRAAALGVSRICRRVGRARRRVKKFNFRK
jgi:hypothetical protein